MSRAPAVRPPRNANGYLVALVAASLLVQASVHNEETMFWTIRSLV